jgi:hypothetical protein
MTALARFMENPNHPGLNFEALAGRSGLFSLCASRKVRIILRRSDDGGFVAIDVGPHDIYRRR